MWGMGDGKRKTTEWGMEGESNGMWGMEWERQRNGVMGDGKRKTTEWGSERENQRNGGNGKGDAKEWGRRIKVMNMRAKKDKEIRRIVAEYTYYNNNECIM